MIDIGKNVQTYLDGRSPFERPASFDYCFNYFQSFRDRGVTSQVADAKNLEASCLHIGYYLASWGMLRGSTILHAKSYRFFEPVVAAIAAEPQATWSIDVDNYAEDSISNFTGDNISDLLALRDRLATALTEQPADGVSRRTPTNTLITKVILGVFGSVPAFDTFFMRGLRSVRGRRSAFNRRSLEAIGDFYEANAKVIDRQRVMTLDAVSVQKSKRRYTRAKIIDMVLLIEGGGS